MDNLIGKQLGQYRLIGEIARGGMTDVYKAYQPSLNRYVILKILLPFVMDDSNFVESFSREFNLVASLEHEHILPVYDYGVESTYPYIVMRFVENEETLKKYIQRNTLPVFQAYKYIIDLASALDYAHQRGIVHLHVKPANVLMDSQGFCYLTDFGIAKLLTSASLRLGQTNPIIGTPAYISPEQVQGKELDQRSDIYSLGIVLYEIATGRVPFLGETPMGVALRHVYDPLPLPRLINPKLPENIEKIILKAVAKDPEDRFATAGEMSGALSDVLSTLPAQSGNDVADNERLSVFICHSSADKLMVRRLYNQLLQEKWIDPWLDEEKLLPGEDWNNEIRKAVKASDCVIVCLSRGSVSKEGYVQKEIRLALDVADEKPEGTIFVIPLKLEECSVPMRLSSWQWVNYFDDAAYPRLLLSLKKRAKNLGIQFE